MTSAAPSQRFCPLCNRPFAQGEAVLRCEGCEVMHHPGCWVTNGGCATESTHKIVPVAMAYTGDAPAGQPAPHPGEGTRVAPRPAPAARPNQPIRFEARPRVAPTVAPAEEVVGGGTETTQMPVVGGHEPVIGTSPRPAARKRYVGSTADHASLARGMPSIYNRHRILRYWYVPVAAVLVVVVALGVVWLGDQFRGSGSTGAVSTTTALPGAALTPAATPAQGATTPLPAGTPNPNAKFKAGDSVTVTGTGDCLNVRSGPARSNAAVTCLPDGTTITIVDGPQSADSLTWWKLHTPAGDGWAAEDYLKKN
ncbi:MAG TPA: RING finger protein [Tepidiformaceae bacterium]